MDLCVLQLPVSGIMFLLNSYKKKKQPARFLLVVLNDHRRATCVYFKICTFVSVDIRNNLKCAFVVRS